MNVLGYYMYIIRVPYFNKEKNNTISLIQIKVKTIKRKQIVSKSNLTLNYNNQNKKK